MFIREQYKAILDMTGVCTYIPDQSPEILSDLVSSATGMELSGDRLMWIGLQVHNIEKAFNTIHAAFTRKDDLPPYRYYNELVKSGPFKGERLEHSTWEEMLDEYYALHGWNRETSWQTRECLEELHLAEVADRLEKTSKLKILLGEQMDYGGPCKKNAKIPYRWF